jgi:hypothetical protein
MVDTALEYLLDQLVDAVGFGEDEISLNSLHILQENKGNGLVLSLLNVEEESTLKNLPHHLVHEKIPPGQSETEKILYRQSPPLSLNLRVVFAFDFDDYGTSLQHLTDTANFFHKKKVVRAG